MQHRPRRTQPDPRCTSRSLSYGLEAIGSRQRGPLYPLPSKSLLQFPLAARRLPLANTQSPNEYPSRDFTLNSGFFRATLTFWKPFSPGAWGE